jgi:hypothetical protein
VAAALLLAAAALGRSAELDVALAQERALRTGYASLVDQQEVVLDVVDSRQTVKRLLQPPDGTRDPATAPYGKLYTRPDLPQVVAMAARLPPPPAGRAYHLWVTQQGQTRLAGVLRTNAEGFGLLVFTAETPGPAYDAALITLEPAGAAPAVPAGAPVLRWAA